MTNSEETKIPLIMEYVTHFVDDTPIIEETLGAVSRATIHNLFLPVVLPCLVVYGYVRASKGVETSIYKLPLITLITVDLENHIPIRVERFFGYLYNSERTTITGSQILLSWIQGEYFDMY